MTINVFTEEFLAVHLLLIDQPQTGGHARLKPHPSAYRPPTKPPPFAHRALF